jgi:hypothetical protein
MTERRCGTCRFYGGQGLDGTGECLYLVPAEWLPPMPASRDVEMMMKPEQGTLCETWEARSGTES